MTRAILRLALVAVGAAVAIWLLPASLHIVDWPSTGPVRVGLFPPLGTLWLCLAGAGAVVGSSVFAGVILGERVPQRIADVVGPFALLWVWGVPYLPWLPDRAPLLLVLAGPMRWGIAFLALFAALWRIVAARDWKLRLRLPGRWAVVALTFAVYCGFGLWSAAAVGPSGDEPHYLIITQSLLLDHDLKIENNHARGDYHEYFGSALGPDYLRRGQDGAIYSIHAPGLAVMLAPVYAAAGYYGVVVLMCLFGALTALAIFDLGCLLGGPTTAWFGCVAVCFSVPFVPHSWLIYPEMPAALITAWAALWLNEKGVGRGFREGSRKPLPTLFLRGVALATLPWLHTKFSVAMVLLAGFLIIRQGPRLKAIAAFAAPIVISTTLWLYYFYRIYGTLDPQAPYGDLARAQISNGNIPRGVLGLLFDQKFGLLWYSPVYLLAAAGCWVMLRRADLRWLGFALFVTFAAFLASTTRYYMWWGGASAPARFLVPALPLLAPFVVTAFRELRSPTVRAAATLLVAFSLFVAVAGIVEPKRLMLFSAPHGFGLLVSAIQAGSPLAWTLPTFTEEPIGAPVRLLAPWLLAALLALIAGVLAARFKAGAAGSQVAVAVLTFVLGGAVMAGAPLPDGRRATAARGRLDLMRADDGERLQVYDYARGGRVDQAHLLTTTALNAWRTAGELSDNPARVAGPFQLPPGRFEVRLWFSGQVPSDSRALIALQNQIYIAQSGPLANPARVTFELPIALEVYVAVSDAALARAVQRVEIVAESIVPRSARHDIEVRALEAIPGHDGAYLIYADDETYPEGGVFWTRSKHTGTVFIVQDGASTLRLTLHVGAVGGRVDVRVADEDHSQDMMHDETRVLEIPLPRARQLVPVTVKAAQQFRPSDHEPGSADTRWLGCQVRVSLR